MPFTDHTLKRQGLTAKHEERGGAKKRLSPPRVAELIARAAYNRADVAWIARHPVLLLGACSEYILRIAHKVVGTGCVRVDITALAAWQTSKMLRCQMHQ